MDTAEKKGPRTTQSRLKAKVLQSLTLAVVKLANQKCNRKLFADCRGVTLCFNFCIESGSLVTLAEAHALRFVATQTSIPVPKVYHAFTYHGKAYILMERIRGVNVAQRWRSLSDQSKSLIFSQLKSMIEELRSVPYPSNGVSNLEGGPLHDFRFPQASFLGPFSTISKFHLALRNDIFLDALERPNSVPPSPNAPSLTAISDVKRLITSHESLQRPPAFTHGDLSSFNVLIRRDKVVGIIDWDMAGWLPYYWEYTTA